MKKIDSGYLSWIFSGKNNSMSLLPTSSEFFYYAFFMLETEEDYQASLELWPNLINEMKDNATLEQAASKVAQNLNLPSLDTNYLPIYRWSRQLLDTPNNEQLLVIFTQKFFRYYLARPTSETR
jgi:hypothetical protein